MFFIYSIKDKQLYNRAMYLIAECIKKKCKIDIDPIFECNRIIDVFLMRFNISYLLARFQKLSERHFAKISMRLNWVHRTYQNCTDFYNRKNWVYWTHLYFLNRFTIKKQLIIPASPFSRQHISPQE